MIDDYERLRAHMGHHFSVEMQTGSGRAVLVCETCREILYEEACYIDAATFSFSGGRLRAFQQVASGESAAKVFLMKLIRRWGAAAVTRVVVALDAGDTSCRLEELKRP